MKADIFFLKNCKKKKVFPNFIKVKSGVINSRTEKAIHKCKNDWLKRELKYLYGKLSRIELETYDLHLNLSKSLLYNELVDFLEGCDIVTRKKSKRKRYTLNKKLCTLLIKKKQKRVERQMIFDIGEMERDRSKFVRNLSSKSFNENEMMVLEKGLNFTPKTKCLPIEEIIADIESSFKFTPDHIKQDFRRELKQTL